MTTLALRAAHVPVPSRGRVRVITGLVLAGAIIAVTLAIGNDAYYTNIAILGLLAVVLAITIRPLLLAGEASFCHGSFYALGAYSVGILSVDHGFSVWLGLPIGGLVAAIGAVGVGVPSLRTTGSYFFLMTFAFLIIVNSLFEYLTKLTGGFSGISGIPAPSGISGTEDFLFLALGLALLTGAIFYAFDRSRWGLELRALGDARLLAQAAGASRLGNMLSAFVIGAFFAGLAGGVYASYLTFISPGSFSLWLSVYALTYVILGGKRYFVGAIVGALIFSVVPVLFNWSEAYVGIFTSAATLVILLLAPRGLVTEATRLIGRLGQGEAAGQAMRALPADGAVREGGAVVKPVKPVLRRVLEPEAELDERRPGDGAGAGPLLGVSAVSQRFGGVQALENVSFEVSEQEVFGIIGPNGAGKTTLFNAISGFARPTSGSVELGGQELVGMQPHVVVRHGLARTFQASSVCENLTTFENVLLGTRGNTGTFPRRALQPVRSDRPAVEAVHELIGLLGLDRWTRVAAGGLPYGARKRLGVAIAMATKPRVLCLDEPMAGLSDGEVEDMRAALSIVRHERQITIVIIEHRVPLMMSLCDRLMALDFGRVIALGTAAEVASDQAVIEAYLGSESEARSLAS